MGGERDDFFGRGVSGQAHDSGVTEVGVAVVIFLKEGDEVAGAVGGGLATKGDGGEGADPRAGILEEHVLIEGASPKNCILIPLIFQMI